MSTRSMRINTEAGTNTYSIIDHARRTRAGVGGRLVQRFDPASTQANLNLMSRILKLPKGKVENMSSLFETWEEMMDMCPTELEEQTILNPDMFDTYPKVKAAIRDYVEQLDEMPPLADDECEGEWAKARAAGRAPRRDSTRMRSGRPDPSRSSTFAIFAMRKCQRRKTGTVATTDWGIDGWAPGRRTAPTVHTWRGST